MDMAVTAGDEAAIQQQTAPASASFAAAAAEAAVQTQQEEDIRNRNGGNQHDKNNSQSSFDSAFDNTAAFASSFLGVDLKLLTATASATSNNGSNHDDTEPSAAKSEQSLPTITPANEDDDNGPQQRGGGIRPNDENQNSFSQKRRASDPSVNNKYSFNRSNSDCSHPSDSVDADGHTWRAKYCVLENGILYFYRYRTDAEAPEAHLERQHHALKYDDAEAATTATDFTMSPMPTQAYAPLGAGGSGSGSGGSQGQNLNTWEKLVALNSVGAVRSAEYDYGANSFELSAADDTSEKLILRARNQEEMNEWLFQFHRSIASYVMDIMESASSASATIKSLAMDIHHPTFSHRPLSSAADSSPERIGSLTMAAFSPRFQKGLNPLTSSTGIAGLAGAGISLTPHSHNNHNNYYTTTPSLSHGHGRNSLHRRRVDISGLPKTGGQNRHSSRTDSPQISESGIASNESQSPVPPFPFLPQQPHDSPGTVTSLRHRFVTPKPREQLRTMEDVSPELSAPQSDYPETERPPPASKQGKYVPPHIRRAAEAAAASDETPPDGIDTGIFPVSDTVSAASSKKYLPPHLRNKTPGGSSTPPSKKYVPPQAQDSYVPRHGRGGLGMTVNEEAEEEEEDAVNGDFAVFFADEPDLVQEGGLNIRLGGCADPDLVDGSILDKVYIPRKASRLRKTRQSSFGCLSSSTKAEPTNNGGLRWEIGAVSECGVRDSNEDAFLVVSDLLAAFEEIPSISSTAQTLWDISASSHSPSLFAVFDGHCGDHAARFAAESLLRFVHERSLHDGDFEVTGTDRFEEVLREAVTNMDDEFCNLCNDDGREWESGATALIAALVNEQLVIANLGDARGVMGRSVEDDAGARALESSGWSELPSTDCSGNRRCFWKQVTDVHSPSREDERARIEKANGWITTEKEIPIGQLQRMVLFDQDVLDILKRCLSDRIQPSPKAAAPQRILQISRVCGELAVSRAIGDRDFKAAFNVRRTAAAEQLGESSRSEWDSSLFLPYPEDHSRSFVGDLVSNQPEFQSMKVGEPGVTDEFLLLACDGLWDVMDADDAIRLTRDLLFEKSWSAKMAATRLAELAVHLGSSDNITVIVVRFCDRNKI